MNSDTMIEANSRKTDSCRCLGSVDVSDLRFGGVIHPTATNNMGLHSVENRGDTGRIHLIFEYYDADRPAPDWLPSLEVQLAQDQPAR